MTTREQIIAAAKSTGCMQGELAIANINQLTAFYAIALEHGRQAEREECAKLCESTYPEYGGANPYCFETPSECAKAIRARGDTK